jgi:hypothetical protein
MELSTQRSVSLNRDGLFQFSRRYGNRSEILQLQIIRNKVHPLGLPAEFTAE